MSRTFNVGDLLEIAADKAPDRFAVAAGDTPAAAAATRRTYRELNERANRVAHHFVDAGIDEGEHVGVLSWNRIEWIETMLGCFKSRTVPINVNYRYVDAEVRYLLDNADCTALVVEAGFLPMIGRIAADLPGLRHIVVIDDGTTDAVLPAGAMWFDDALAAAVGANDGLPARTNDDQYILYTGGTTGMPKGVQWRLEDFFFAALGGGNPGGEPITSPSQLLDLMAPEPAPTLVTSPMMHGNGQWNSLSPILAGRGAILWTGHRFDPAGVAALAAAERPAMVVLVGDGMARPFVDHLTEHPGVDDLSSVKAILSGGAILSPVVKRQLSEQMPGCLIIDGFGASETGGNGSLVDPGTNTGRPRFQMGEHTTVLGPDLMPMTAGTGETGMLARRGHIPLGYYGDPAKTAATFPTAPDGTRWAVPGDAAILEADGTVTLLGRGSNCINTGGEKVYPEEVESAIKTHPDIADAIVVGTADDRFGQQVTAVASVREGAQAPALEALREHLRQHLAGYKLPRRLVIADSVQYTGPGKPDYAWARRTAEETA